MFKVCAVGVMLTMVFQAPRGMPVAATDLPGSPSVLVTVMATGTGDHLTPDLLTFWRGNERWYLASSRHASAGGSATSRHYSLTVGTASLSLELLALPRRAVVGKTPVDLGTANVLLMDAVDSADGPRLVKALTVEIAPSGFIELARQAAASTDVRDFLRCPDPQSEAAVRPYVVCAGLVPTP